LEALLLSLLPVLFVELLLSLLLSVLSDRTDDASLKAFEASESEVLMLFESSEPREFFFLRDCE